MRSTASSQQQPTHMSATPHLEAMEWDDSNRMQDADIDGNGGDDVCFRYGAEGNRVRNVWENENSTPANERHYPAGVERDRERDVDQDDLSDIDVERETLHTADDTGRIVMVETRTIAGGQEATSPANIARYEYGTTSRGLDENVIIYQEYDAYGASAYRAVDSIELVAALRRRVSDDVCGLIRLNTSASTRTLGWRTEHAALREA